MKFTPATTAAAIVLIGAGGFAAGRLSSSDTSATQSKDGPAERTSSRISDSSQAGSQADSKRAPSRSARADRTEKTTTSAERLAGLSSIVRGENALERNRALLAYIDQLGPNDFEEAVAGFRGLGITESRMGEYSLLLTAWAEKDPTSALAFAQANTGNGFARDTILTTWGTTDPDAAIRWAQANFEGDGANPYLAGIIRGLASTDTARASELLAGMPRSGERGQGLDYLIPQLLQQKGGAATRAWIDGLTDDSLKNGAILRSADQLAATDPAGTAAWLIANPGEASKQRLDDVYQAWVGKDSQAALAALGSLPAGEDRSNALRGVVGTIASQNPQSALTLMNQYPNDLSDGTIRNFVRGSFVSDPALAVSQISRIADQGDREQSYRRSIGYWYGQDPAAAVAWVNANQVPDSVRNDLIRRQKNQ